MIVAVYADGGVIARNPSPFGGTYAWCHVDEAGERVASGTAAFLGAGLVTNNQTEFAGLVAGLEALPAGWSGEVCSDSQVTLGRLFWQYKLTNIPPDWIDRGARALTRLGCLTPVLVAGHPTRAHLAAGVGKHGRRVSEHNVWCDQECSRLAREWLALFEETA